MANRTPPKTIRSLATLIAMFALLTLSLGSALGHNSAGGTGGDIARCGCPHDERPRPDRRRRRRRGLRAGGRRRSERRLERTRTRSTRTTRVRTTTPSTRTTRARTSRPTRTTTGMSRPMRTTTTRTRAKDGNDGGGDESDDDSGEEGRGRLGSDRRRARQRAFLSKWPDAPRPAARRLILRLILDADSADCQDCRSAMALPTGPAVTFLFTDIEGSTRLERALGSERVGTVVAEHDALPAERDRGGRRRRRQDRG